MDPADYRAAVAIFERCLALEPEDRAALLDAECGADPALRARVERMLEHDESSSDAVQTLMDRVLDSVADPDEPPETVGPYRVIQEIGRGGMGIVYEAEQTEPRRRVALKVLSVFGSAGMARRLRQEAHVLGQLEHPGIARVFDAGTATFRGHRTPYIAMELVRGVPIDEFARSRPLRHRLELAARVADAVHAAHLRGVVHRDLKPGNILVAESGDGVGAPKVLDFGVARVRTEDLYITQVHTETGQLVGTLSYMSPEQLAGRSEDIDARCDVYALGVLLEEMLTGRPPEDLSGMSLAQAVDRVRDPRPREITVDGRAAPAELALIVSTATAADPDRRYASAEAFADDLRAYLAGADLIARPPSATYQLREFARRNRALVSATVATIAALAIGLAVASWFAVSASISERRERWTTHRALISAASSALDKTDFRAAERMLEETPKAHRAWEYHFLRAKLAPALPAFGGVEVRQVAADDDSGAALGVADGRVLRWAPGEDQPRTLPQPQNARALAPFVRRGLAVAILADGAAIVFDAADGSTRRRFDPDPEHAGWSSPTLDAQATLLSLCAPVGGVVWSIETGEAVFRWDARDSRSRHAVISPDGRWLAITGPNELTRIINLPTGQAHRGWQSDPGLCLAFSPDSTILAVGSTLRDIHILSVESGRTIRRLRGHTGRAAALLFAPDGRLFSAFHDESWRAWDVAAGEQLLAMHHPAGVSSFAVLGDAVITTGVDAPRLWNTAPDAQTLDHPPYVYALDWSPDGRLLASTAFERGGTNIWDVQARRVIASFSTRGRNLPVVRFVTNNGPILHGSVRVGVPDISVWSIDDQTRLAERVTTEQATEIWGGVEGLTLPTIRYSPDGRHRIEGKADQAWQLFSRSRAVAEITHDDALRAIAWSPDSSTLATGSKPGAAKVWAATTGEQLAELEHVSGLWSAAFTPDGRRLLTGGDDGVIRVYDTRRWQLILEFRAHETYVHALAFSPDGTLLASGSGDGTVRLWDTLTGDERATRIVESR